MRRVVADQIKALNEFSALVSRSNRVVDAAPAGTRRAVSTRLRSLRSRRRSNNAPHQRSCPLPMPVNAPAATFARHAEPKAAAPAPVQLQNPAPMPAPSPVRQAPPSSERLAPRREDPAAAAAVGCPVSSIARPATKRSRARPGAVSIARGSTASNPSIRSPSILPA